MTAFRKYFNLILVTAVFAALLMQLPKKYLRIKTKVCWRKNLHFKPTEMLKLAYYDVGLSIFLRELLMKKSNDTFKRLRAVR